MSDCIRAKRVRDSASADITEFEYFILSQRLDGQGPHSWVRESKKNSGIIGSGNDMYSLSSKPQVHIRGECC